MPSSHDQEEELFALIVKLPLEDREAFLRAVCRTDQFLRQRLEALLAANEQGATLLATQPDPARADVKLVPADAPDEAVGQALGRYKLLERVGEGGCGVVYVAQQTEPVRRRVAVKVIKLGMDTKQVVARFEAERQALAMMDHPNIAKVLDAGTTDLGRPYFVMELVRGIRITDYCDQAQLSTKDRLDLFIKVCQAIQHAHQKGIIHRDIKPSNILVTLHDGQPVPKVIDFGIAKATEGRLTDATVYTNLHQFIGTPAYMSPEQAEMSGLDIDTRSDIYSLGVLLYELLAGSTPFDAQELMASGIEAMRKTIREKEPARPSTRLATMGADQLTTTAKRRSADTSKLMHQLKGDLDWIVMKCLEKDRTRRYETANGLSADLKRHLNNEPVIARPPTAVYRFQKAYRRNKLAFASGAAIATALLLGIVLSAWQAMVATLAKKQAVQAEAGKAEEARIAKRERDNATVAQSQAQTAQKLAENERRQAQRLLYAADMNLAQQSLKLNNLGRARRLLDRHRPQPGEEDLRGWEWRYLWQLTRSSALVTLTNRANTRGFDVSFSPDGRRLAVGWTNRRVELWDVPAQRLLKVLAERAGGSPHVAFSPVRNLLAASSQGGEVTLYDLDSGMESVIRRESKPGWIGIHDLSFSPDGSLLVIYALIEQGPPLAEACVVDVSSSQILSHVETPFDGGDGAEFFGAAQLSPSKHRLYLADCDRPNERYAIQCMDLASRKEIWKSETQQDSGLSTLALSPDGRTLVSGSGFGDATIRVWDAETGRLTRQLEGHSGWVYKLAFSRNGRLMFSAAADQTIRVWETATWSAIKVLRGHTDEVQGVAVSETAHLIASTSKNGDLMLWGLEGTTATDGYTRLSSELRSEAHPLDHSLVAMVSDTQIGLFDLRTTKPPISLTGVGGGTNWLGSFGTDVLGLWDGTNQILLRQIRGSELIACGGAVVGSGSKPMSMDYNPKRQLLAWTESLSPNLVFLANATTNGPRLELKSDIALGYQISLSVDGDFLYAATKSADAWRVWNVESGRIVTSSNEELWGRFWTSTGRILVGGIQGSNGQRYEIAFYDFTHPERPPRRVTGLFPGTSIAQSPDGGIVAAADLGGVVRLLDPAKGEVIATLHGHLNAASGLAFSPDGRRLISTCSGREAVKLWDLRTHQELLTLPGVGSWLNWGFWTADGDAILAGQPWQTWRAPSWAEINAAEAKEKAANKQP